MHSRLQSGRAPARDLLICNQPIRMSKIILINLSGGDRPGLTSSITAVLARYEVRILDIGQAVVHETLALAMLIEVPAGRDFTPLKKDLIVAAHELDLQFKVTPTT